MRLIVSKRMAIVSWCWVRRNVAYGPIGPLL